MKKRTNKQSDKDQLIDVILNIFEKSKSLDDFKERLASNKIQTYTKAGFLTGAYHGRRKYRFKRSMGINLEILLAKNEISQRLQEIKSMPGREANNEMEI